MATSRPRGFINNWQPKAHVEKLIQQVHEIQDDNSDILPLTLRQIFYMLVSNYQYNKDEQAYKRLCETLNKARRAHMISMSSIRDDGFKSQSAGGWGSEQSLIDSFKYYAKEFTLRRQENQPVHLMIWCEAAGMLPQLATACGPYGVSVMSSGGFDSVTTKHDMAEKISNFDEVEILHIGDHDPSGVHICSSLDEDLQAFVGYYGGIVNVTRLAVTPEQIEEMNLPTAPAKKTDRRNFEGRTTQAEAIPPRKLREIVIDAIESRMDMDIYHEILEQEETIRESLAERLEDL